MYKNKKNKQPLTTSAILELTEDKTLQQILDYKKDIREDLDVPRKNKTKVLLDKSKEIMVFSQ